MTEINMKDLPQEVLDKLDAEEVRYQKCITNLTNASISPVMRMQRLELANMKHDRLVNVILFNYTSRREERTSMGNS